MKAMRTVGMLILLLVSGFPVWSQTDRLDSLLNEVLGNDKDMMKFLDPPRAYCYLYGGFAGDNKTIFTGNETGDDLYGVNGNIYFLHSKGFFTGVSGLWFSQNDPEYSTTIATAGYLRALNRKRSLTLRASYYRYFYNTPDSAAENAYKNSIGTGLTLKNKWIGGRLSLNFLFGQDFRMNITPGIFSRITLARFGKFNKIQTEPEISLFIGSETVEYASVGDLNGTISGLQPSASTEDVYGLLNTQFFIPVCLYIGNFDLELGYSLNLSTTQYESFSYPVGFVFTVSLGYLLPFN